MRDRTRTSRLEEMKLAGVRVAFRRAGAGPLLVLLHGAFADSRAWRPQLEELSDEYTVVAWDGPGCGGSDDPPEGVDERGYVAYLAQFVDALDLGRPAIVGHSLGGVIALALERHRPGLARALVLVSTYAGWTGSLAPEAAAARIEQAARDADLRPDDLVARYLPEFFTGSAPRALLDEAAAMIRDVHPAGLRALVHGFGRADLRDVLPRIDVPTLLVWGQLDRRSPLRVAHEFRSAIDGAELVVVPGVGHESPLQAPAPFNAAVRRFLRSVAD